MVVMMRPYRAFSRTVTSYLNLGSTALIMIQATTNVCHPLVGIYNKNPSLCVIYVHVLYPMTSVEISEKKGVLGVV